MLKKLIPLALVLTITACSEPAKEETTTQQPASQQEQSAQAPVEKVGKAAPGRFKAGEDYQILEAAVTDTPTVTEYFSFYCPACYRFEPLYSSLKDQVPENTKVTKKHVSFMGGDMGEVITRGYAVSVVLDVEDKIVPAIFNRLQVVQNPPRNLGELRQLFVDEGVDGEEFDAAYESFAVNSMASEFDKSFERIGLRGTPSVVVNGKFHVTPKTIETAEEYYQLINFLLEQS